MSTTRCAARPTAAMAMPAKANTIPTPKRPPTSTSGVATSTTSKGRPANCENSSMNAPNNRKQAKAALPME